MKRLIHIAILCLAVISAASCGESKKPLLPNVSGKAGEVLIVMPKADWEGSLGSAVREVLACDCPYLAQKEPLYSLVNIIPTGFVDLFKVHRNIVIFNIDPQCQQPGVVFRSDVWATPQCVIQVSATDSQSALEIYQENSEKITSAIEQAERNRVIGNTMLYEQRTIFDAVCKQMGGSPHFPTGYKLLKQSTNFAWVADNKQYTIQGVLIYKYPAKGDASDFTEENLVAHRDSILKANVPGMFDNTYMITSQYITPQIQYIKYQKREFTQMRGFWEVYNDYMGGPFVSHSFYSKDGKEIIVLDAFVYAPKYDKRQYLRQVESLLYSFEWKNE